MLNRAEILKQQFQNSLALPFEQVLSAEVIQTHIPHPQLSHGQDLRLCDRFDPSGRDPIE